MTLKHVGLLENDKFSVEFFNPPVAFYSRDIISGFILLSSSELLQQDHNFLLSSINFSINSNADYFMCWARKMLGDHFCST